MTPYFEEFIPLGFTLFKEGCVTLILMMVL